MDKMNKIIRSLDIFGQSVQLTFRRESSYKSTIGGVASIFSITLLCSLMAIKILEYSDVTNAQNYQRSLVPQNVEQHNLYDLKFRMAVNKIDPRFGELKAFQVRRNETREDMAEPIEFYDCSSSSYDPSWYDFFQSKRVAGIRSEQRMALLCPNITKMDIGGQYSDPEFSYVVFKLKACNSTERECFNETMMMN